MQMCCFLFVITLTKLVKELRHVSIVEWYMYKKLCIGSLKKLLCHCVLVFPQVF